MKFFVAVMLFAVVAVNGFVSPAQAQAASGNRFVQTNLVANRASYAPEILERKLVNAWGLAIRPAGAGGHFWVTGKDISFEYVGDVKASADAKLRPLHMDKLAYVHVPVTGDEQFTTGVVFNDSKDTFVITQDVADAAPITAPAKFLFSGDSGLISAWTERKKDDGSFDRPVDALTVIDRSKDGAQYFGLTLSHDYQKLYAANFGVQPGIEVFEGDFTPSPIRFDQPFDTNTNGMVDPGEYAPFNIQALTTPAGDHHIFVSYAKTQQCPAAEIKKNHCKKNEIFAGEEDTSKPGQGRIAEFTEDGKLVAVWPDAGKLSAPWGMVFAPQDFGALSGALLIGNFGSGTIAAFDSQTHQFIDVMRNSKGKTVRIEKLWGLLFGNGESLGDRDALYFAAGPKDEKDGVFGSLRLVRQISKAK